MKNKLYTEIKYVNYDNLGMKYLIRCPKCGGAAEVDTSRILTSYPAQYKYKCEHCGHDGNIFTHEVDSLRFEPEIATIPAYQDGLSTSCLICGESVPVTIYDNQPKVCEKCKKAILKVRKMLEED